jgi:hypothetical protein
MSWASKTTDLAKQLSDRPSSNHHILLDSLNLIARAPTMIKINESQSSPYFKLEIENSFLGPIKDACFDQKFDLVFSSGVLKRINPDDWLKSTRRMFEMSARYVLIGEYFNRTPIMINYRAEDDKLFKCDSGKLFVENFNCTVLDYGFLWGQEYDSAGFDDINYWLIEKSEQ